ncbi:MAG: Tn3 family transposase, partial [Pseudomonadota bacterium]
YDQPIVLGRRQAGAAIDGVMKQPTSANLEHLAVDTHGYTNFGMAIAKLLGFDLCPRLSHLKDRRLYVPTGTRVPEEIEDVVACDVSLPAIDAGWDGLVRVAASIATKHTSASLALQRFGSAARGDPTHKAGAALGMLYRTLFLCDYFTNRSFRRELNRVLNYGETVHTLQRAIYTGNVAPERGRRADELTAISGSLALMSNLVMAWTTSRMQAALDQNPASFADPEIIRHIGPVQFRGVNFRGCLHFPIKRFAHRLLDDGARSVASRVRR